MLRYVEDGKTRQTKPALVFEGTVMWINGPVEESCIHRYDPRVSVTIFEKEPAEETIYADNVVELMAVVREKLGIEPFMCLEVRHPHGTARANIKHAGDAIEWLKTFPKNSEVVMDGFEATISGAIGLLKTRPSTPKACCAGCVGCKKTTIKDEGERVRHYCQQQLSLKEAKFKEFTCLAGWNTKETKEYMACGGRLFVAK